jgi:hypothetical protein
LIRRHARKIVNQLLSCGAGLPAMLSHAILQHCERRVVSAIPMQFEQQLPRLHGDNYLFEHRTQAISGALAPRAGDRSRPNQLRLLRLNQTFEAR